MRSDGVAVDGFNRPGLVAQKTAEEVSKGPLADKADSRAVRLVEDWQARAAGSLAYITLFDLAQGHQGARQQLTVDGVEKVALILARITGFVQLDAARGFDQSCVVACGKAGAPETGDVVECDAELDLAVAKDVRIRRAASLVLSQKVLEDPLTIFGCKAHAVQRNAQLPCHRTRVLKVLGGGAVAVVVVVPVAHEQAVRLPSLFLQEQGGDGRIDAAGKTDDDARVGHGARLYPAGLKQAVRPR